MQIEQLKMNTKKELGECGRERKLGSRMPVHQNDQKHARSTYRAICSLRPIHTMRQYCDCDWRKATSLSLWACSHGSTVTTTSSENGLPRYQQECSHKKQFCSSHSQKDPSCVQFEAKLLWKANVFTQGNEGNGRRLMMLSSSIYSFNSC